MTTGNSLIAAPIPSAAPAKTSRRHSNANKATMTAATAKMSQFWKA